MNRFVITMLALVVMLSGCRGGPDDTRVSIPTLDSLPLATSPAQHPDELVATPGGVGYRANLHQQGEVNLWPPIESITTYLGQGTDEVQVRYRSLIETPAGETRYNIISVTLHAPSLGSNSLNLYIVDPPPGLVMSQAGGGGMPGVMKSLLMIEIPSGMAEEQYEFKIGVEINGVDYGTLPCVLVVQSTAPSFGLYLADTDELVLSEQHIAAYRPDESAFILNEEGITRWNSFHTYTGIPKLGESLYQRDFIIKIEGEELCRGKFYSLASSASYAGLAIIDSLLPMDTDIHNKLWLISDYPGMSLGETYDSIKAELAAVFESLGLLG